MQPSTPAAGAAPSTSESSADKAPADGDGNASGNSPADSWGTIFDKERAYIKAVRGPNAPFLDDGFFAVCLSGGGIRSATFALGVLHALAEKKSSRHFKELKNDDRTLLERLDYLSTVSGGGYIGSWITCWMRREGRSNVVKELKKKTRPQDDALRDLRRYSQYLSPRLGLTSGDSWALAAIYTRNIILLWLLLVPVLFALMLVPRCFTLGLAALVSISDHGITHIISWWMIFSIGAVILAASCFNAESRGTCCSEITTTGDYIRRSLIPKWIAALLLSLALALRTWVEPADYRCGITNLGWWVFFFAVIEGIGWYGRYSWLKRKQKKSTEDLQKLIDDRLDSLKNDPAKLKEQKAQDDQALKDQQRRHRIWRRRALCSGLLYLPVGIVLGGFLWLLAVYPQLNDAGRPAPFPNSSQTIMAYVALAPSIFFLAGLVAQALLRGLLTRWQTDAEWEWNARAAGWVLLSVLLWVGLISFACFAPFVVFQIQKILPNSAGAWLSAIGALSGIVTVYLGSSSHTPASKKKGASFPQMILAVSTLIFLAAVLLLMVILGNVLVEHFFLHHDHPRYLKHDHANLWIWHADLMGTTLPYWWAPLGMIAVAAGISIALGYAFDINRISLHNTYRNRLTRAYLGASNPERERKKNGTTNPSYDPFTGFNVQDNPYLYELQLPDPKDPPRIKPDLPAEEFPPLQIINVALNLTSGQDLAWQERKAASFTFSPLACGSAATGIVQGRDLGFRPSRYYGGLNDRPVSVGTALTISGAAVSPNMGYHSSPLLAFLLTFFNVRLGAWLGNPAQTAPDDKTIPPWKKHAPPFALASLLGEALGTATGQRKYLYLSDGGHFENLGLYEMVRRRCRYIIISDAGADPDCGFEDLAKAVEKIRADFGYSISLSSPKPMRPIRSRFDENEQCAKPIGGHYMVGTITYYDLPDAPQGQIIYIKASYYDRENFKRLRNPHPSEEYFDVVGFAKAHADFPHHTTADQFFNETMFESYRALGYQIAMEAI